MGGGGWLPGAAAIKYVAEVPGEKSVAYLRGLHALQQWGNIIDFGLSKNSIGTSKKKPYKLFNVKNKLI